MNINTVFTSLDYFIQKRVLHELALGRWRKYGTRNISAITKKRKLDKGSVRLQRRADFSKLSQGVIAVPVESAKEQGKWDDVPEYKPRLVGDVKSRTERTKKGKERVKAVYIDYNRKGHYTVTLQFQGWREWANDFFKSYKRNREKYIGLTKGDMISRLIREVDVKFHCDCPSFYWQGMQWWLTRQNAAIEPVNISSQVWVPKHKSAGGRVLFCKHIIAVLEGLEDTKSYLYQKLAAEIKQDRIFKPVIQAIWGEREIIPAIPPADMEPIPHRKGYRPPIGHVMSKRLTRS